VRKIPSAVGLFVVGCRGRGILVERGVKNVPERVVGRVILSDGGGNS